MANALYTGGDDLARALRAGALGRPVPSWSTVKSALMTRPELAVGRAEIARAEAEVQVMQDMFPPMATALAFVR